MKKFIAFLVTVTFAITMLAGCAKTPTATPSTVPTAVPVNYSDLGTLNLDWGSSIGTDSVFECPWADVQSMYSSMVFDTLIKVGPDGKTIVPALAKSCDISADGKTYTFTLVDNAKWHDGTAFTAADVLFSFNAGMKVPESGYSGSFTSVVGVQDVIDGKAATIAGMKADGNKIIFTLSAPDNTLIIGVFSSYCILPEHLLKNVDPTLFIKNEAFWKKPIGTGAYKIDEVSFPSYFSLARNDTYFGNKAKIKKVLFTSHVTGGQESIIADVIAGKLDYIYGNATNDINNAKNIVSKNPEMKIEVVPSAYMRFMVFNNVGSTDNKYNTDMQKPEVRQALNLLIDKDSIASLFKGQAVPLSTCVNPALPGYNTDIPLFKRDAAKAKAMLTAAGFDFTRTIRILYYYSDQATKDLMEIVKQNFADAGVKAEPFLASTDLAATIYTVKNWDMMYAGYGLGDPIWNYEYLVPGNANRDKLFGDIDNRQSIFGKLFSQYKSTTDAATMKKIGDQMQVESNKYCILIPIYGMNKIYMYNSSKLKVDENIFKADFVNQFDFNFSKWELLK